MRTRLPVVEQVPEQETIGQTPDELPDPPAIARSPVPELIGSPGSTRPAPESTDTLERDRPTPTEPTGLVVPRSAPTPGTAAPGLETTDTAIEPKIEPEPERIPRPIPPAPGTIPRTYTVQTGDTFASIAQQFYGDERAWFDIAQANPSIDPKRLQIGQQIVLPNRDADIREREQVQLPAPDR